MSAAQPQVTPPAAPAAGEVQARCVSLQSGRVFALNNKGMPASGRLFDLRPEQNLRLAGKLHTRALRCRFLCRRWQTPSNASHSCGCVLWPPRVTSRAGPVRSPAFYHASPSPQSPTTQRRRTNPGRTHLRLRTFRTARQPQPRRRGPPPGSRAASGSSRPPPCPSGGPPPSWARACWRVRANRIRAARRHWATRR